jgi:hypothetical protein
VITAPNAEPVWQRRSDQGSALGKGHPVAAMLLGQVKQFASCFRLVMYGSFSLTSLAPGRSPGRSPPFTRALIAASTRSI